MSWCIKTIAIAQLMAFVHALHLSCNNYETTHLEMKKVKTTDNIEMQDKCSREGGGEREGGGGGLCQKIMLMGSTWAPKLNTP